MNDVFNLEPPGSFYEENWDVDEIYNDIAPEDHSFYDEFTEPYEDPLTDGPYTQTVGRNIVHYDDIEDPDAIDDPVGYWNYVMGGN